MEANPERVNDSDDDGNCTPLFAAVSYLDSLTLTLWLLDEKGADVNGRAYFGATPLFNADSIGMLIVLLDHGADPTMLADNDDPSLMIHAFSRL